MSTTLSLQGVRGGVGVTTMIAALAARRRFNRLVYLSGFFSCVLR